MDIYVCDHVRASVSGLFKDLSCPVDFCPLKFSFIYLFIYSAPPVFLAMPPGAMLVTKGTYLFLTR